MALERLQGLVRTFCEERDWEQFHSPKELAIGLVTESAELLDEFRFLSEEQQRAILATAEGRARVEAELADVLFFILRFAQLHSVDLPQALERKLEANAIRYPVDRAKGSNLKARDLQE